MSQKVATSLICLLIFNYGISQIYTPDTNAYRGFVFVELRLGYENNAINNDFVDHLFSDKFIPRELRETNIGDLEITNEFGAFISQRNEVFLKKVNLFNRKKYGLKIGFDWSYQYYGKYNKNLFELTFLGNDQFEGRSAVFFDTQIDELFYQRLTFGFYNKSDGSFLNLGFNKGSGFRHLEFLDSEIYTAPMGTNLLFDWNGLYQNSTSNDFMDFNGWGISMDAKKNLVQKPTQTNKYYNLFSASISNLGFMKWNKSEEANLDTTFNFEGYDISGFLDDSFTFPDQSSLEDSILPSSKSKEHFKLLPFRINASALSIRQNGLSYGFEIEHWFKTYAIPEIRFNLGYLLQRNFKLTTEYTVGGYQKDKVGFYFEWEFDYTWYWKIGTHHIIDSFDKNGLGRSIFVVLKRDLR